MTCCTPAEHVQPGDGHRVSWESHHAELAWALHYHHQVHDLLTMLQPAAVSADLAGAFPQVP